MSFAVTGFDTFLEEIAYYRTPPREACASFRFRKKRILQQVERTQNIGHRMRKPWKIYKSNQSTFRKTQHLIRTIICINCFCNQQDSYSSNVYLYKCNCAPNNCLFRTTSVPSNYNPNLFESQQ